MKSRLAGIGALILLVSVSQGSAQTSSFRASPALFSRLFQADVRRALRAQEEQTPPSGVRQRVVNRTCAGCESRPGTVHFIIDSPLLTDGWIAAHQYHPRTARLGDNAAIADFWYDGVHRRIFSRSAVFHEVDDPADLRLGRAPGRNPDRPDFDAMLTEGTTVGQIGFDSWRPDGFGSYFAAIQGTVRDAGTGYLVFATATGQSGVTRTGSRFEAEDLIRHVRLHPSGQFEIGFETPIESQPDPLLVVRGAASVEGPLRVEGAASDTAAAASRPDPLFVVRGAAAVGPLRVESVAGAPSGEPQTDPLLIVRGPAAIEGPLRLENAAASSAQTDAPSDPLLMIRGGAVIDGPFRLGATGGNVPHACTVRSATTRGRQVHASCEPSEMAISGGGTCQRGDLKGSRPLQTSEVPDGWEVSCGGNGSHTAFVICCSQ